jgi:hypothetical protein
LLLCCLFIIVVVCGNQIKWGIKLEQRGTWA